MKDSNKNKYNKKNLMKRVDGYTLMEVLIALAIFAIGILGVATMQISSTNGNTSARKYSEASEIGQGQIESLMALSYANVADGNLQTADGYSVQWTVVSQTDIDLDGDNDIMEVRVVVNDPGGITRADLSFRKAADI